MISQSHVTVNTTAVVLASAGLTKKSVTIRRPTNNSSLFLGNSSVTTADGIPFYAGELLAFELQAGDSLYCIADAANDDEVAVMTGTLLLF